MKIKVGDNEQDVIVKSTMIDKNRGLSDYGCSDSSCFPDNVSYAISLGGIDTETFESIAVNPSMQFLSLAPGQQIQQHVYIVPSNYTFRLEYIALKHITSQARADIWVKLKLGGNTVFESGHLVQTLSGNEVVDISVQSQTRTAGIPGMLYGEVVANATSTGVHDNYNPVPKTYGLAFENDHVIFDIINQSDVYTHVIGFVFSGWSFRAPGRSKCSTLLGLAK